MDRARMRSHRPVRSERSEVSIGSPEIRQLVAFDWTLARTASVYRRFGSTLPLPRACRQRIFEIVAMRRPARGHG